MTLELSGVKVEGLTRGNLFGAKIGSYFIYFHPLKSKDSKINIGKLVEKKSVSGIGYYYTFVNPNFSKGLISKLFHDLPVEFPINFNTPVADAYPDRNIIVIEPESRHPPSRVSVYASPPLMQNNLDEDQKKALVAANAFVQYKTGQLLLISRKIKEKALEGLVMRELSPSNIIDGKDRINTDDILIYSLVLEDYIKAGKVIRYDGSHITLTSKFDGADTFDNLNILSSSDFYLYDTIADMIVNGSILALHPRKIHGADIHASPNFFRENLVAEEENMLAAAITFLKK